MTTILAETICNPAPKISVNLAEVLHSTLLNKETTKTEVTENSQ